ncbi:MAG: 23S rRNA (pseudouridine(1915)-N(3))-methyltransferase RlmH [Patescibacteria group bacterium]
MDIRIVCVGRLKESFWREAQAEYDMRLKPYAKLTITEVAAEKLDGSVSDTEAMRREGEKIMKQIPIGATIFALDKSGKQFSSEKFSSLLNDVADDGTPLALIIGGAAGLHRDVLSNANRLLSLSEMTLPHELARVFLLEQIYRAVMISRGKPYHR